MISWGLGFIIKIVFLKGTLHFNVNVSLDPSDFVLKIQNSNPSMLEIRQIFLAKNPELKIFNFL